MNPIIQLSELCQKEFGQNIETSVDGTSGADHCPEVFVTITLPNGEEFKASGSNKKIAKQEAAKNALQWLDEQM